MSTRDLKAERVRAGKSITDMANALGISYDGYVRKERGESEFRPAQIIIITETLGLSADLINTIFFDGRLPIGSRDVSIHPQ